MNDKRWFNNVLIKGIQINKETRNQIRFVSPLKIKWNSSSMLSQQTIITKCVRMKTNRKNA